MPKRGPRHYKDHWQDALYQAVLAIGNGEEAMPDEEPSLEPPPLYRPKEHDAKDVILRPDGFPQLFRKKEAPAEALLFLEMD